eukprot:Blabericola_migrator_1__1022@NODE_1257_length_4964_cov_22_802736_g850_i0_p1_GENE_NODE_1257_length_4964_cov_22_802736_g850_i0NODE_1257_length_4964_cov_22_802736_g850_i0_p1_ORF_typecomplete_len548_score45_49_NODE_1257_length_4964_cov_22_802736_g850_i010492692
MQNRPSIPDQDWKITLHRPSKYITTDQVHTRWSSEITAFPRGLNRSSIWIPAAESEESSSSFPTSSEILTREGKWQRRAANASIVASSSSSSSGSPGTWLAAQRAASLSSARHREREAQASSSSSLCHGLYNHTAGRSSMVFPSSSSSASLTQNHGLVTSQHFEHAGGFPYPLHQHLLKRPLYHSSASASIDTYGHISHPSLIEKDRSFFLQATSTRPPSDHRSQSSSILVTAGMGNYSSSTAYPADKTRLCHGVLSRQQGVNKRTATQWGSMMGGTGDNAALPPVRESLPLYPGHTSPASAKENRLAPPSPSALMRSQGGSFRQSHFKFTKGRFKSSAGSGSPRSIAKQSNRMLSKLLYQSKCASFSSTPGALEGGSPVSASAACAQDTLSIHLLLSMTTSRLSESQVLTATAKGYFSLISSSCSKNGKECDEWKDGLPSRRAGGSSTVRTMPTTGSSMDEKSLYQRSNSSYEDLCFRAVAMLRSCDYPLEDIFCLFGVAAAHIDSVFLKLRVNDVLEKVYIALLQVREILFVSVCSGRLLVILAV